MDGKEANCGQHLIPMRHRCNTDLIALVKIEHFKKASGKWHLPVMEEENSLPEDASTGHQRE